MSFSLKIALANGRVRVLTIKPYLQRRLDCRSWRAKIEPRSTRGRAEIQTIHSCVFRRCIYFFGSSVLVRSLAKTRRAPIEPSMLIRFPPNKFIPWSEELPLAKSASGSLFFNSEEK
jgi:hypothetical protein